MRPVTLPRLLVGAITVLLVSIVAQDAHAQHAGVDEPTLTRNEWRFMPGAEAPMVSAFARLGEVMFMGTHDKPNSYTNTGALFMSANGGLTWRHTRLGGPVSQVLTTPLGILAVVGGVIHHSPDGRTWQITQDQFAGLGASLTTHRTTIFGMFNGYGGGVFARSEDGGATWQELPMPDWGPGQLLVVGRYLFGGNSAGLFRSADWGMSWEPVSSFPHDPWVVRMAQADGIIFVAHASTGSGLYRSTDFGETWQSATQGLANDPYGMLRALTRHNGALYTSVTGNHALRGLHVSHNDGLTWTRIAIPGLSNQYVTALHSSSGALIAGTLEGAFRTKDDAATWSSSYSGASAAFGVSGIHATDGRLLVGTSLDQNWGHGIWRTEDHGSTWQLSSHPQFRPTTFHEHGNELLAGGSGSPRGVARSVNGGAGWIVSNSGMWPGTILYDLFEHNGVLLAAGHDALYRSTDGGYNWTAGEPQGIRSFARIGAVLYAAHRGAGVFRSTDGGQSWSPFSQGLTGAAFNGHYVLEHERRLYLGTDGLGVWRLDGDQWTHIGPGNARVTAMVGVNGGLVIGTRDAPYLWTWSENAGWEPFDQGLVQRQVDVLVRHGSNLYVGLPLAGLWHRPVPHLAAANHAGVPDAGVTVQPASVGVYPNPATTSAVIAVELGDGGQAVVQLIDVLGREVTRWDIPDDQAGLWQQTVDTSRLAAGLYLVRATVNGSTVVHRLTVAR